MKLHKSAILKKKKKKVNISMSAAGPTRSVQNTQLKCLTLNNSGRFQLISEIFAQVSVFAAVTSDQSLYLRIPAEALATV